MAEYIVNDDINTGRYRWGTSEEEGKPKLFTGQELKGKSPHPKMYLVLHKFKDESSQAFKNVGFISNFSFEYIVYF